MEKARIADWQRGRSFGTDTAEVLEKVQDEFPFSIVESEFSSASYFIGQAVVHIARASEEAERYGMNGPIEQLIEKLDDGIRGEMDELLRKYREAV